MVLFIKGMLLVIEFTVENSDLTIGSCINPMFKYLGMLEISINVLNNTKKSINIILKYNTYFKYLFFVLSNADALRII